MNSWRSFSDRRCRPETRLTPARIRFSTGIELVNRERYGEAEQYFRRALAREPLHISYAIALGRSLYDQEKVVEAITVFDGIKDSGSWNQLLKDNLDEAYQKAIDRYQALILREPNNARAYYSLGTMYSRTGRIEESIEQYKRAVALKPDCRKSLFNLASSYGILEREDKAIEYYRRIIAGGGAGDYLDYNAYRHLGEIYQRQGDQVKAQEYFKNAEVLKGNKPAKVK